MQISGVVVPAPGVLLAVEWLTVSLAVTRGQVAPGAPLATVQTDALGRFRMVIDNATPWPAVSFSLTKDGQPVSLASWTSARDANGIDVTLTVVPAQRDHIAIASYADLVAQETDVVARLGRLPQGGLLFFTDPVRALGAAGVEMSPQAVDEFRTEHPYLSTSTAVAFNALLSSPTASSTTIQIHGLFEKGAGKP